MLAYFLYHSTSIASPLIWIINILIYLIIALILWLIVKYVAVEFGIDPRIVKLLGLLLFLVLVLSLFVGCTFEFGADGSKKVSFRPTLEDYKEVRSFTSH